MRAKLAPNDSTPRNFRDRRAFPRVRTSGTGLVRPADEPDSTGVGVILSDVSHGGISFIVDVPLQVGQVIIISIRTPGGLKKQFQANATIRWITLNTKARRYFAGCEWQEPISLDDLLALT